jgi:hypothetical protein
VQDPSNNEQKQNQGNGKRIILKYAHGAPPIHIQECQSHERPGYEESVSSAGGPLYASKYLKSVRGIYFDSVARVNGLP